MLWSRLLLSAHLRLYIFRPHLFLMRILNRSSPEVPKMKKNIAIFALLILLVSLFPVRMVYASADTTIDLQGAQLENTFTFDKLGYAEKLLVGPFDSTSISFGLPANQRLAPGSSLSLEYALAWSGGGVSNSTEGAGV